MTDELSEDDKLSTLAFEDLPIVQLGSEYKQDGWHRTIQEHVTVAALLETWDIETDTCEMAQVLRHLRRAQTQLALLNGPYLGKNVSEIVANAIAENNARWRERLQRLRESLAELREQLNVGSRKIAADLVDIRDFQRMGMSSTEERT